MYRRVALWIVSGVLIVFGAILTYQFTNEFFLSNGYFKGTHNDFLAFWATGKLVADGNIGQVYSVDALTAIQRTVVPHPVSMLGYMPFLNPPFVAVLLAPLGILSINDARLAWMLINIVIMMGMAWYFTRGIANRWQRGLLMALISTSYPVFQNLIQGQLSILLAALSIAALYCAARGHLILSGVFLACLTVKPQLALFVGAGLLIFKQWRVIQGMIIGTTTILLLTLPLTGVSLYADYAHFSSGVTAGHFNGAGMVSDTTWEGNMKYMYSLPGLTVSLFGQKNVVLTNTFNIIVGAIFIGAYLWAALSARPSLVGKNGRYMMVAGIAIVLLINPHAYSQDALLLFTLLPILLLIWNNQRQTLLIFLSGIGLLYIDQQTGWHLMTLALLGIVAWCLFMTLSRKDKSTAHQKIPCKDSDSSAYQS